MSEPKDITLQGLVGAGQGGLLQWAEDWFRLHKDAAFRLVDEFHTYCENAQLAGIGRLDGVHRFSDELTPLETWCDSGVLVLGREWNGRGDPVFIIGDLHGDIGTLQRILQATGTMSGQKPSRLLFLGDIGDRSEGTAAVWAQVLALQAAHPDRIVLLRGNHEDVAEVRCEGTQGELFSSTWWRPTVACDNYTFMTLGFFLGGRFDWAKITLDLLPSMAILPGGVLAVHGGHLPRWQDRDGWKGSETDKEQLSVAGLCDLRKPKVQMAMRWAHPSDKADLHYAWSSYQAELRVFSGAADFEAFSSTTGLRRLIHGHTHPESGCELLYDGDVAGLNSNTITGERACIARYEEGMDFEIIAV